jgi:hypothetical protein
MMSGSGPEDSDQQTMTDTDEEVGIVCDPKQTKTHSKNWNRGENSKLFAMTQAFVDDNKRPTNDYKWMIVHSADTSAVNGIYRLAAIDVKINPHFTCEQTDIHHRR